MIKLFIFFWMLCFSKKFTTCTENAETIFPGTLIEGDIMLTEEHSLADRRHGPLVDMRSKRWPSAVVPYDFNETVFTAWDQYVIKKSLMEIEKDTCVRFIRRSYEKDYIFITPSGGCWSYVGRNGMQQILSLLAPHCINQGTIIHEFMHALGFWHEHSRSDRDEYIEIIWKNIRSEDDEANFAQNFPEVINFKGFPYDYQSVMHYDAFSFSKSPKLPTMRPKKPGIKLRDLGRAKTVGTLTKTDKEKLNSFYECEGY